MAQICQCATGCDLINITPLTKADNFGTWLTRLNQVIDSLNAVNLYTVQGGITNSGIDIVDGCSAGSYNGVVSVIGRVGPGVGIGPGTTGLWGNRFVTDFAQFTEANSLVLTGGVSGAASSVGVNDEYIVNDVSDTSLGSQGTPKKVAAQFMLPPYVKVPTLTIDASSVSILGSLFVGGDQSFIASNDLRIEDKQIELAYQLAGFVGLTGVTSGTFLTAVGATVWYADSGSTPDATGASVIGIMKSFTGAGATGKTGIMKIGSVFELGGPEDFQVGGRISVDQTTFYTVVAVSGTGHFTVSGATTEFFSDSQLSQAGFIAKGASGDKSFLWINSEDFTNNETVNAWMSSCNLGVRGATGAIIGRVFQSFGYSGNATHSNEWVFLSVTASGSPNKDTKVYLGQEDGGAWLIRRFQGTGDKQYLEFSSSVTGLDDFTSRFGIYPCASGQTYTGTTIKNFAKDLNADLLDGAHAGLTAKAFTIPVSGTAGTIDSSWFEADRIRKTIGQTGHQFPVGFVVRYTGTGYTGALADTGTNAEVLGIVERVVDANSFILNMRGWFEGAYGITGYPNGLSAGNTYFLSPDQSGRLILDPDTQLSTGDIRKPVLFATGTACGYVMNFVGAKVPTPTDLLYLPGLVPVGTVHQFNGDPQWLTREWKLCNGDRLSVIDYPEYYARAGQTNYAIAKVVSVNGTYPAIVEVDSSHRGLSAGDLLTAYSITGTQITDAAMVTGSPIGLTSVALTITAGDAGLSFGTYIRLKGTPNGDSTVFFLPDARRRYIVGTSIGQGMTAYNSYPELEAGFQFGGGSGNTAFGLGSGIFDGWDGGSTGSPASLAMRFITRVLPGADAVVLTGHNHDTRYIRYDGVQDPSYFQTGVSSIDERLYFRVNGKAAGAPAGMSAGTQHGGIFGLTHNHDLRYLRKDTDDTMHGSLTITGDLGVSGSVWFTGITGASGSEVVTPVGIGNSGQLRYLSSMGVIGSIIIWPFATLPASNDYLECNGALIDQSEYPILYSMFANHRVPNMVGLAAIGAASDAAVGTTGGQSDILLTNDQIPGHYHTVSSDTVGVIGGGTVDVVSENNNSSLAIPSPSPGDQDPVSIVPPRIYIKFIIKAR